MTRNRTPQEAAVDSVGPRQAVPAMGIADTPSIDSLEPPQAPGEPIREMAELLLVEVGEAAEFFLTWVGRDGSRGPVLLGTWDCVALAAELLEAAPFRMGRADPSSKLVGGAE